MVSLDLSLVIVDVKSIFGVRYQEEVFEDSDSELDGCRLALGRLLHRPPVCAWPDGAGLASSKRSYL